MHRIVSYIDGYGQQQIQNLVNSVRMSGFRGQFLMFIGDQVSSDTIQYLQDNKVRIVYPSEERQWLCRLAPVVRRFYAYWEYFGKDNSNDWVVCVDAKDIVFQYDPIKWLSKYAVGDSIVVGGENVKYEAEPWGNDNFRNSFPIPPLLWDTIKEKEIYNAGSFACKASFFGDFCKQIFLLCMSGRTHNPDQAALNILVNDEMYALSVLKAATNSTWALQCGTTHDPTKHIMQISNVPGAHVADGVIYYDFDRTKPYCIVHQYDRVPHLKVMVDEKYGSRAAIKR